MLSIIKLLLCVILIISAAAQKRDVDAIKFPDDDHMINYSPRMGFHIHHNHGDDEGKKDDSNDNKEIPLSFLQKLNEIDNFADLENFLEGKEMLTDVQGISSRFGNVERTAAIMPKPATCIPTLQTVELKNSTDSSLFFFPSCTRVERCGGCCSHSLLSCQPVQTETVAFQVVVSQYTGGSKLSVKGKEIMLVEKHTKCKCDCIMKAEDCNSFQEYRKDECRCACTNMDEKKKCDKFNETKLWDPNVCKCRCRNTDDCTTGSFFDQNKCTCVPIPVKRRFAELGSNKERPFDDRDSYTVDSLGVSPLQGKKDKKRNVF